MTGKNTRNVDKTRLYSPGVTKVKSCQQGRRGTAEYCLRKASITTDVSVEFLKPRPDFQSQRLSNLSHSGNKSRTILASFSMNKKRSLEKTKGSKVHLNIKIFELVCRQRGMSQ
jgi:hypothetical protein